jgi:hypothetical protein
MYTASAFRRIAKVFGLPAMSLVSQLHQNDALTQRQPLS